MTILTVSCVLNSSATTDLTEYFVRKSAATMRCFDPIAMFKYEDCDCKPADGIYRFYIDVSYPNESTFKYHKGTFFYHMRGVVEQTIQKLYGPVFQLKQGTTYAVSYPYDYRPIGQVDFGPQVFLGRHEVPERYTFNEPSFEFIHSCA